jgi:hypothetical protein
VGMATYTMDPHRKATGCGRIEYGATLLCDMHQAQYERQYPQGWRYYPGDVCRHGMYVGGCGVDLMCGACEGGD